MKQRRMTMLALGCGVAAALCVFAFMAFVQSQADQAQADALARYGGEQIEVCVATRDISAGERLDYSALEKKMWVAGLLPDDAICESTDVIGKTATSSIVKGEVINARRFEQNDSSFDIPAGKQAVSVPIKTVQAVGGSIKPGMTVNVYSSGDTSTTMLASDVLVLDSSMGENSSFASSDSGWLTLAIDSNRTQEIISASNKTSLYFVLPGETNAEEKQSGTISKGAASDE